MKPTDDGMWSTKECHLKVSLISMHVVYTVCTYRIYTHNLYDMHIRMITHNENLYMICMCINIYRRQPIVSTIFLSLLMSLREALQNSYFCTKAVMMITLRLSSEKFMIFMFGYGFYISKQSKRR